MSLIAVVTGVLVTATLRVTPAGAWDGTPFVQYVASYHGDKAYRATYFSAGSWANSGNVYTLFVSSTSSYANIMNYSSNYSCANHNAWGYGFSVPPGDIHGVNMEYSNTPQYDTRSHFWYVDSQYSNNAVTIYTGLTNNESYCWATSYLARMYDFVYPNQYYVSSSLALDSTTYP
jgi:hypothetical protein